MSLNLLIESSAHPFSVIFGEKDKIIFNSSTTPELYECREIYYILIEGLKTNDRQFSDLKNIYVNIGPGGLNSVRSGVAFANALSYSLNIPICYFNTFELTGFEVWEKYKLPVLCSTKANNNRGYFGLIKNGKLKSMKFGEVLSTAAEIIEGIEALVVAGFHRESLIENLHRKNITDSAIKTGNPATFYLNYIRHQKSDCLFPNFQIPLNEQSPIFNTP